MMLRTWWIFTFGIGQEHGGKYVRIWGTYSEARAKMVKKYGDKWAFQYEEKEYLNYFKTHPEVQSETFLEEIE